MLANESAVLPYGLVPPPPPQPPPSGWWPPLPTGFPPSHRNADVQVSDTTFWVEELWTPYWDDEGFRCDPFYVKADLGSQLTEDACWMATRWLENMHGAQHMQEATEYQSEDASGNFPRDESLFLSTDILPTFTNYLAEVLKFTRYELDFLKMWQRRAMSAEAKLALLERDLPGVYSVIQSRYRATQV